MYTRYTRRQRVRKQAEGTTTIVCAVCGEVLESLAPAHLRMHGLTFLQYRHLYPEVPTITKEFRQLRREGSTRHAQYLSYHGAAPDDHLCEFLVGTLLGDGSLEKAKVNARYSEGGSNELYLRWKHDLLNQYFPCSWRERISAPHTKSGKRYQGWWLRTAVHPLLTQWYAQWYQPRKEIARQLVDRYLTPFALAVWFCDDGYTGEHRADLYSMAFTLEENNWLAGLLEERFGFHAKVLIESQAGYPFLSLPSAGKRKLQAIIAPFHLPGMEYKYT